MIKKKNKKNPKNKDQTEINIISIKKNYKFDLNDKIKNYERFDKRAKEKKWRWNRKKQIKSISHLKKKNKRVGTNFERWKTWG